MWNAIWPVILVSAVAGIGGTGLGGVASMVVKRDSKGMVSLFLSFAAGVMISVVCFSLLDEALFVSGETPRLWLTIGGVMAGYGVIALLNYWIDKNTNHELEHIDQNHPMTADSLEELVHYDHFRKHQQENKQLFLAGVIMAFAIALHNLPEGMVIGASYAADQSIYAGDGLIMAMIIGLHDIPEGMAVAVPLISGGMSKWKAALLTALSGAPTVLGAVLGYLLGELGPVGLALSLSFASGAMIYVTFGELLPESILMQKNKWPALAATIGMMVGMIIIFM